ncbi:MAG: hypothetical protein HC869_17800 [Rhodospirillales bacterium]|nr:hypothetical protein [Rhodospirillales bacterium]
MSKAERNQLILAKIKETTERGLKSKAAARKILIAEGIYTKRVIFVRSLAAVVQPAGSTSKPPETPLGEARYLFRSGLSRLRC